MYKFEDLLGLTLTDIIVSKHKDTMTFVVDDGRRFQLFHEQDCCESVTLYDVCGELDDLVGTPILLAELVKSHDNPVEIPRFWPADEEYYRSQTWSFYKLATIKGYVTLRWYGSSNGCYSESVSFRRQRRVN